MAIRRTSNPLPSPKPVAPARTKSEVRPVAEVAAHPVAEAALPKRAPPKRVAKAEGKTKSPAMARSDVPVEVRRAMIAEAAYLRAERRGFVPGYDEDDWLAAENEVDTLMRADHTAAAQ
jgi:hypothetical protein